jgi:hypothetical protein
MLACLFHIATGDDMPVYCDGDQRPKKNEDGLKQRLALDVSYGYRAAPEQKPIGMRAVAAAIRYERADLGELMRQAAAMAAAMTIKS